MSRAARTARPVNYSIVSMDGANLSSLACRVRVSGGIHERSVAFYAALAREVKECGAIHCQWLSSWYTSAMGTPDFSRLRRARTMSAEDILCFLLSS